ncbi:MAG TPA: DUF5335 family protein [Longimicrobium sp.]
MDAVLDRSEWPRSLAEFTQRNAGRTSHLEVDDPSLGAQPAEDGMTFRGATYDLRNDRLEIMLGDQGAGAAHLTHSVEHPDGLAVAEPDPRHAVLRIAHGTGQTLLTVG